MRYRFYTADVFTKHVFGGNPLAVFPDACGLTAERMQAIAREFNPGGFLRRTFSFRSLAQSRRPAAGAPPSRAVGNRVVFILGSRSLFVHI